jgi:hypothetical protein
MASKRPTRAHRDALAPLSPVVGKQMRARYAQKAYEVYDAADDDGRSSPMTARMFDALLSAGWVERAETVYGVPLWRLSEAGLAVVTTPPSAH